MREEEADTGGPTQALWRLITEGIKNKFCTEEEEGKMVFKRNTPYVNMYVGVSKLSMS